MSETYPRLIKGIMTCDEFGCENKHHALGKCRKHYNSIHPKRKLQDKVAQHKRRRTDKFAYSLFLKHCKRKRKLCEVLVEDFMSIRERPCSKCNRPPCATGLGVDFVDPKGLAVKENLAAVCGPCRLRTPKEAFDLMQYCKNLLRRKWKSAPMAQIALQKSKLSSGLYECAACHHTFRKLDVEIDHEVPVVSVELGFVDLDTFARRLYCDEINLQVLCKPCHKIKTKEENSRRKRK